MSTALRLVVILGLFALLAAAAIHHYAPEQDIVGSPAPDFALPALSGGTRTLSSMEGRVTVVNFWATWCGPCVAEMPSLQKLNEALQGEGLHVVGISVDTDRRALESFVADHGLTFPILQDADSAVAGGYGVGGYPETFVIDAKGTVIEHYAGPAEWHTPEALAYFRKLLAAQPPR